MPVIASDIPPNIEMGQKLKLNLFEALNYYEPADIILTLWKDDALTKEHSVYNSEHVSMYSWDNVALQYLSFIQKII